MNTDTGRIYDMSMFGNPPITPPKVISMEVPPTPKQLRRGRVGRNDPCPCGSGKKFKRCHMTKE